MTALDALAPTHALFCAAAASAAARTSARSAPSAPSATSDPSAPDWRKYIILDRDARELPILFPRTLQHDQACPAKAGRLVSAGCYLVINGNVILLGVGSASLNLKSRPQDAALIRQLISESD